MLPYLPGSAIKSIVDKYSDVAHLESADKTHVTEIVFFGRLETRKGLTLFCDVLDLLVNDLPEIKVTFLGRAVEDVEGLSSSQYIYQRAIAGQWPFDWKILSNKDRQSALEYLKGDNILTVIPSLIDNAPYTVYECLYASIPFIASNTGSIVPLISEESKEDALFDTTPEDLKNKILSVHQNGLKVTSDLQCI
jgi:glycosyltransferase involved in cell wall biosynthesis